MSRDRSRFRTICFVAFLALAGGTALGQNLGSIVGLVTDATGAAVPGAKVTVTQEGTGVARSFETDATGTYLAPALPNGTYQIEVAAQGFKAFRRTDIVLNVRDQIRVDVQLELGQITETVEVVGQVVSLQTENAAVEDIVSGTQVQNISMNGRNFMQLAALVPGASSRQPAFNTPVGVSANANISFNGLRATHNVWRVDGQENYDRGCGGCVEVLPSIDAIEEFKVGTANSDVDLGFGAAGQINVSIKSGTNDFHGAAYEFLRNDAMDATNYFLNRGGRPKQKLRFNNFGYNIGGPVLIPKLFNGKNKLFFFWNQEWRLLRSESVFSNPAIPAALRTGDFSGFSKPIFDPTTGGAFPGNQIPDSRINPDARILADPGLIFPLPNTAGNRFTGVGPAPIDVREEIARIDYNITSRHLLFFRFVMDTIEQTVVPTMWAGGSYPSIFTLFKNNPKMFHWQMNSTLSPNLVNEASLSFSRQPLELIPQGNFQRPANLGIKEIFPENRANRLPNINFVGELGVNISNGSWPWTNNLDTFIVRDSVIWNKGNHTLRLGGEYMPFAKRQDLFGPTQGAFEFQRKNIGHEFAAFLLGDSFKYSELERQTSPNYLTRSASFHGNDTWRISPRLTLNLGLRWDALPHAYEENDRVAVFYPGLFDPARAPTVQSNGRIVPGSGDPLNGIGLAGQGGIPRGMVQNHWNLFQPRIGIAWRPWGEDTVIRLGVGLFTERIQGNDIYNVGPNPPNSQTAEIFDAPLSNPGGGEAAIFPRSLQTYDGPYKLPQVKQYNFGIQRRLSSGVVLNVGYVGTQAAYLQHGVNINQLTPAQAALVQAGQAIVNQVRPYIGWDTINSYENGSNSNYNSLQVGLRADNWRGLTLQASYTWSHAIDYVSSDVGGGGNHQDAYNWRAERANADFDRRQMLILNYVYNIPTPSRWGPALRAVLGDWTVSGITSFQSGVPLNVSQPGDNAFKGGGTYRPNLIGDPKLPDSERTGERWFNPNAFASTPKDPVRGFGNAGRNIMTQAGINNWDLSVFKSFPFKERFSFQYRAEFYNAWNHTQWSGYRTGFGSAGFGEANAARDARVIQMGLKFYF